jgi:hypothetical protein
MEPADLVSTAFLSEVLGLTKQGLARLSRENILPKVDRGQYELAASVQRYIDFKVRSEVSRSAPEPNGDRVKQARAAQIERRMAREDREIIALAEAVATVDEVAGEYLQSIGSLPARITRDPRERQRIEAICDAERLRLSDRFVKKARDLRSGGSADEADDEDDA